MLLGVQRNDFFFLQRYFYEVCLCKKIGQGDCMFSEMLLVRHQDLVSVKLLEKYEWLPLVVACAIDLALVYE